MASITVDPKVLTSALATVKPAVTTNGSIVALKGVRICSNIAGTHLYAGNHYGQQVRCPLPNDLGLRDGDTNVVVSHQELAKVAKLFAGRPAVTLETDDTRESQLGFTCSNGNRKVNLGLLRIDQFPEFPQVGGEHVISCAANELRAGLLKIDKFRSRDQTRPILGGIRFVEGEMVATDSYRLCVMRAPGWHPNATAEVTIQADALLMAAKSLPKGNEGADMFSSDKWSHLVCNGVTWAMRNVDGQYPNYRQLMPDYQGDGDASVASASVANLLAGANIAKQLLTKNAPVRLKINGNMIMSGYNTDGPSFEEEIEGAITNVSGKPNGEIEIGLNPEFLHDILASLTCERARIRMLSPLRPALVENTEDDSEKHLIMPIRLN